MIKINRSILAIIISIFVFVVLFGTLFFYLTPNGEEINVDESYDEGDILVYWYWSETCPICHEQMPFIEDIDDKDHVTVIERKISNEDYYDSLEEAFEYHNIDRGGTPTTIIEDEIFIGDSEQIRSDITDKIDSYDQDRENTIYPSYLS